MYEPKDSIAAPPSKVLFSDVAETDYRTLSDRADEFADAMTKATAAGLVGETVADGEHRLESGRNNLPLRVAHRADRREDVAKALEVFKEVQSVDDGPDRMAKGAALASAGAELMAKEWTLSSPISTGLGYRAAA